MSFSTDWTIDWTPKNYLFYIISYIFKELKNERERVEEKIDNEKFDKEEFRKIIGHLRTLYQSLKIRLQKCYIFKKGCYRIRIEKRKIVRDINNLLNEIKCLSSDEMKNRYVQLTNRLTKLKNLMEV